MADRIREARSRKGWSQARLAEEVGVSQPTVAAWERAGGHKMTRENRDRVAAALDVASEWIEYAAGRGPEMPAPSEPPSVSFEPPQPTPTPLPTQTPRVVALPSRDAMPLDVPVYGVAAGNPMDGAFQLEEGVIDYVRRAPGILNARDVYALYVVGESMWPRFRDGELIYISASRPVRIGDDVILCLPGERPGEPERCFVKTLTGRRADVIEVEQYNPPGRLTFARSNILRLHRVLTMTEVLGV